MYTLGINAAFHDPSACLVRDGQVVAAAEDERFTHVKHGKRPVPFTTYFLPHYAIDYCLKEAGIKLNQVDHVAYSFNLTFCLVNFKMMNLFNCLCNQVPSGQRMSSHHLGT